MTDAEAIAIGAAMGRIPAAYGWRHGKHRGLLLVPCVSWSLYVMVWFPTARLRRLERYESSLLHALWKYDRALARRRLATPWLLWSDERKVKHG